ncbi:MAG: MerR family transcriptional regulator [Sulfobacillus sp.]
MKDLREPNQPLHSIRVVKEATGLTDRRIRYYETLELLQPQRTAGNQRLYSQQDIERLKRIKQMLDNGISLKEVRQYLQQEDEATGRGVMEDVERDAESYFQGKRLARKDSVARESLYPLTNRAEIIRRLDREDEKSY